MASVTIMDLGSAKTFAVLAGTTLDITGNTIITNGDIGASAAITGVPPATLVGGSVITDATTISNAHTDLTTAYNLIAQSTQTAALLPNELGGVVLTPNIYYNAGALTLATGDLTLNGSGTYIFRCGAAFAGAASLSVQLLNGAVAENVIWQVTGAFSLGASASFSGTLLCYAAIALGANCIIHGQLLSVAGAVSMANSAVRKPDDAAALATAAALEKVSIMARTQTSIPFAVELPDGTVVTDAHVFGENCQALVARLAATHFYRVPISSDSQWELSFNGQQLNDANFLFIIATAKTPCTLDKHQFFWHNLPEDFSFLKSLQILTVSHTVHIAADARFCVRYTQRRFSASLATQGGQQVWIDAQDQFVLPTALIGDLMDPIRVLICDVQSLKRAQLVV